jgi:hypothetical protein
MEKYAAKREHGFTYSEDWGGFNIPGPIIREVILAGIPDMNKYDYTMLAIESMIRAQVKEDDFYLIGVSDEGQEDYLDHELAHGLFYTNDKYKRAMTRLVKQIPTNKKEKIFASLREEGYCEEVLIDETQAYCATGVFDGWKEFKLGKEIRKFQTEFVKYVGKAVSGLASKSGG